MPGYTPHHTHSHLRGKKLGGWGVESGGGNHGGVAAVAGLPGNRPVYLSGWPAVAGAGELTETGDPRCSRPEPVGQSLLLTPEQKVRNVRVEYSRARGFASGRRRQMLFCV